MSKKPKVIKMPTEQERKNNGLPSWAEMVNMEFNIPDVQMGGFDSIEQYEKWLDKLMTNFEKLHMKNSQHFEKVGGNIEMMLIFLNKYPELFGEQYGEVARDMFKFYIHRHMDNCQKLIDRVSEIEKEYNLPIH